jgi:hypothetical protein
VKIGFTRSSPHARLATLQTGSPSPLKLLDYFPGTLDDERRLHEAFKPLHIHLEWFRLECKLQDFIWYLDHEGNGPASRDQFEVALHDVLMQGTWYPYGPVSADEYYASGDWEPFRALLWETAGPWEE